MSEPLTDSLVWLFMTEGCNADEIAAFAHVSRTVAVAWMSRAARQFADNRMAA